MIKTVFTVMTLAAIAAASPALAATHHRAAARADAEAAYARASAADTAYTSRSNLVVDNGQVVGADPDPFIRTMIERDHGLQAD
ncbi:MAG: hypothetical protein J0H78_17985 [Rhizobiales bacterium]|nr:hypothetical protein [Hyphomicrobiales bacterium]OJY44814.1 MAG: hypothetical protein BGP08_00545 [Rhizobiales bacterium 64-17]